MLIKRVLARKIKNSNGEEAIEVNVNGSKASAPSGKSKGKHESRPYYRSINFCVKFLNRWAEEIKVDRFEDLEKVEGVIKRDLKLRDVKRFGGDALFAFESSILKALAKEKKKELWEVINPKSKKIPFPVGNVVGGGLHSRRKEHPVFQEFLIIPKEESMKKNVKIMRKLHKKIGKMVKGKGKDDEGAWQTLLDYEKILNSLSKLRVDLGIDVAASSFYKNGIYRYNGESLDRRDHIKRINEISKKYNLLYLEDPLQEEDFRGFSEIKGRLIVGDDLTVTNLNRIKKAVSKKSINAVIVKPNQNGSLLEVKKVVDFCKGRDIKIIFSHRAGETMDNSLADYAFGFQADYIKTGVFGKERQVKLKRLVKIEKMLKKF